MTNTISTALAPVARVARRYPEAVLAAILFLAIVGLLVWLALSGAADCPDGQTVVDWITIEMGDVDVPTPICG